MRAVSFSLSLLILTALHIALAPVGQAAAQAPDPLTLTITAERSECTAGTLNPVSWTITGGTPPYTLTVAGETVAADAESATVTCGALPRGASTAPATISAVVMDAAGWTTTTSTAYTIVPPFHGPLFSERAAGVEPVALTLTAVRAECTAGTLNPVVWTITGGTPPDTLMVDGAIVDADAERTTVTCGNLPAGAAEAPGTITASVTDAAGTTTTARAAYTIVPPLPPPTGVDGATNHTLYFLAWERGEVGDPYLVRWRRVGPDTRTTDPWVTYLVVVDISEVANGGIFHGLPAFALSSTYEVAVAKARDGIERKTPTALLWSAPVLITTYSPLTGFEASATHDTITVTVNWDPPPWAKGLHMTLRGPHRRGDREFTTDGGIPDQVVFRRLPPDTWYTLYVRVERGPSNADPLSAKIGVKTAAAPAGWRPLPRGPQNLRTTVTHEGVTVDWDAPYPGADDVYTVELAHEGRRVEEAIISGGVTTHAFTGLAPATPYRVWVTHSDIVSEPVRVGVRTQDRSAAPLRLTLSVERAECTTGASTPISWTITGGTPLYTLTVAREPVAADEGAVTVRCGGLRADGRPIPETIEAHVTDDTGAMASAVGTYIIVPPVPAPLPSARPAGAEPLALTLTAERSECTAGTLNPVTWTITGGTPPDTLTIDGEPVNADAAGAPVTCGDLPDGAAEAPATITASVTDASGATATARAAYTIVPPLPAPTGLSLGAALPYQVTLVWDAVEGAGSQSPVVRKHYRAAVVTGSDKYLFRYRAAAADATAPYELIEPLWYPLAEVRPGPLDALLMPTTTGDYLGMVAAIRHPIEQETPAALHWSAPVLFGVVRAPENVAVQTAHDTLDVSWDAQPYVRVNVRLEGGGIRRWHGFDPDDAPSKITVADDRYHTRFHGLTPETEYEIEIKPGDGVASAHGGADDVILTVVTGRTMPAPAGWEPLPRGPQNLRASATHDSITVTWDPPFAGAKPSYSVYLNDRDGNTSRADVDEPPWSFTFTSGPVGRDLLPSTRYSIRVTHHGAVRERAWLRIWTPRAQEGSSLRLTLAVERGECAAGTRHPVTWEISGGVEPYRLTVDGLTLDPDAESATVTCGALPYGATEAPATISAGVMDKAGTAVQASAAYTIVPPRPPSPTCIEYLIGAVVCTWPADEPRLR